MKHIINFLSSLLAVVLIGATFAACAEDDKGSANVGLGIKVFFPTKVVTNQPMTINGSGFDAVTEIEFPGGTKVSDFELVSNDMIKVNVPSGIPAEGGKIIVHTPDDQAESRLALTVGHTKVTGFSKQPGETAAGGEQITVYGSDLEFVNNVELLDADGEPQLIDHKDFYRKGTNMLIFTVPLKNIFKGTFVGVLHTYDGQSFPMPELAYEPYAGGGHWELQEKTIWDTETVFADWSATILIDPSNFADVKEGDIIRVYTKDKGSDYNPIFKHENWSDWEELQSIKSEGDDYFESTVTSAIIAELQDKGLRFQGVGFTITKVTLIQNVWIEGDGHMEIQENSIWTTETVFGDWSATILIGPESFQEVKEGTIVRVYTKDKGSDYNPIFKHENWSDWEEFQSIKVEGDDYFESTVTSAVIPELQDKGLRFQGVGFTITKVTLIQEVWVDGGTPSEYDIKAFTVYQNEGGSTEATMQYPYYPSWGDDAGKLRIMRGLGDPAIETLNLSTSSKFVVYKEVGTTGQIQWNDPNWGSFSGVECNDWDGSAETIEVPITEDMLKCIKGETQDGWSNTAIILQGDGLTVTKIILVP